MYLSTLCRSELRLSFGTFIFEVVYLIFHRRYAPTAMKRHLFVPFIREIRLPRTKITYFSQFHSHGEKKESRFSLLWEKDSARFLALRDLGFIGLSRETRSITTIVSCLTLNTQGEGKALGNVSQRSRELQWGNERRITYAHSLLPPPARVDTHARSRAFSCYPICSTSRL